MFIFFKIFILHTSGGKFRPTKPDVVQINWVLVQEYIVTWLLQFIFLCFQIFCLSWFFSRFGLIIRISSNWLKFRRGVDLYMLVSNSIFIFSKFLSFIFLWKICSENLKFSKLTKIKYRCTLLYVYYEFYVSFSNLLSAIFSGEHLVL